MGKLIITILILYLLYYVGNIVYDLFFKKSPTIRGQDEGNQFAFGNINEDDVGNVKNTTLEDVEEIRTPSSYDADEEDLFISNGEPTNFDEDLNSFKQQYEEEQALEPLQEQNEIAQEQSQKKKFLDKFLPTNLTGVINSEKIKNSPNLSDIAFYSLFENSNQHFVVPTENGGQTVLAFSA